MYSQRWNIKNFLTALFNYHGSCIILCKYKSWVLTRNRGKCLEIVAVSLGHSRSIVVTIGSEVESLLKVGRGRSWRRSGAARYRSEECVPGVRSASGCLIGWVKVTIYLPACSSSSTYFFLHTMHSRASTHAFSQRTWNRDCQKRSERARTSYEIASISFGTWK